MKLKLPTVVLSMLKKRGATLIKSHHVSRAQLVKEHKEHDYPLHPSVIAFDAAFGSLVIPDDKKYKKDEPCWLFGAHASITMGGHESPRGGSKGRKLVPVVCSPNDIIYYLDPKGRAFAEDTIEDESATLYAENGTALVCRIVFHDAMFSRKETSMDLPGLQGADLS